VVNLEDDGRIKVTADVRKVIKFLVGGMHGAWDKCDELRREADEVRRHFRAHIEKEIEREQRLAELEDENRTLREIIGERDAEIEALGGEVAKLQRSLRRSKKRRK
jgi:predicted RNase H-like nuclease (RuvC/YqgF family)